MDRSQALKFLERQKDSHHKDLESGLILDRDLLDDGVVRSLKRAGIWRDFDLFMYAYYVDKNIHQAKQHLSIAGMCADQSDKRAKANMMAGVRYGPWTILMSDNNDIYNNFLEWDYGYLEPVSDYGKVNSLYCLCHFILKGEYDKARDAIELWLSTRKEFVHWTDPLIGLMERNETPIIDFVRWATREERMKKQREETAYSVEYALFDKFSSFVLKMAWIKGMEIEIDSPYIPMDLMPIEPLETYKIPYYFLDGYVGELPDNYKRYLADEVREEPPQHFGVIKYENEEGEMVQEDVTMEEVKSRFINIKDPVSKKYKWIPIPEDFKTWDTETYSSRAETYLIGYYHSLGVVIDKDKEGKWKLPR